MSFKIFIHGLESGDQGTKARFFKERYPDMAVPNFTGILSERMAELEEILSGRTEIRLVGSSFGGLMASIFAMEHQDRVDRMILLAPALNLLTSAGREVRKISRPVSIYHGSADQVIPLKEVERIGGEIFTDLSFHIVEDDHFLHKTFFSIDWDSLLG